MGQLAHSIPKSAIHTTLFFSVATGQSVATLCVWVADLVQGYFFSHYFISGQQMQLC